MKFIQVNFIDDENEDANESDVIVFNDDVDTELVIDLIKQTEDGWQDLDCEEKWENYGGYFDYLSDWLDKKGISYSWLQTEANINIHNF